MSKFLLPFNEGHHRTARFSPTSIILASFIMGVILSLQTQIVAALSLIGLILLVGTFANTRWRVVISLAAKFEIVVLFWILLLPFFYGTTVVFVISLPWGLLTVYQEGLDFGFLIGLRIYGLITMFLASLSHMSLAEFIGSLKTLRLPSSILGSLLIMLRYIPLFVEERLRMQEAQELRGYERGKRMERIRSIGFLVGSTIDRAMVRSVVVYESMALRGFGRGMHVTGAGVKRSDILLFLAIALLLLILLNWQTLEVLI